MWPWEQGKPVRAGKPWVRTPVRPDAPPSQWLRGGNAAAQSRGVQRVYFVLVCVGSFCMATLEGCSWRPRHRFLSEALGGA